jgi:hypothetical protein
MHIAYYNTIFSVVDMHSLFIGVEIILTDAGYMKQNNLLIVSVDD